MNRDWNEEACNIIKAARIRRGLTWEELATLLKKKTGEDVHPRTLSNRVNNGAFTFSLALQILAVLKFDDIEIPSIKR